MSKAVLVVDMPKRCKDCFRYRADPWYGGRCTQAKDENGWNKKIEADEEYNVQNWCPLRPYEESIPVEWIDEYTTRLVIKRRFLVENGYQDIQDDRYSDYISGIMGMLDDWEKENDSK